MMKYLAAPALLLLITASVYAQDKPLPPPKDFKPETRRAMDALPVLNLPEYVITGSDVASFTDDRKSGIADPDDRGLTARAGRGEREQRFMGTSPTRLPLALIPPRGLQYIFGLRAGYGSFHTPSVQAWYADRYVNGDVALDAGYEQSRGYVRLADYENMYLGASGGTYLPKTAPALLASSRLEGDFRIEGFSYGLFADKIQQQVPTLDFQRKGSHVFLRGGLLSRKNSVFDHELSLFFASTSLEEHMSVRDTLPLETWDQVERRIGLDFASRHSIEGFPVNTRGNFHFGDLRPGDDDGSSPLHVRMGASSRMDVTEALTLDAGLDMLLFRGSAQPTHFRLYPQARLSWRLHDDYTGWVAFEPSVRELTFEGLRKVNPFIMLASELRHTDVPVQFSTGVAFDNRRTSSGRLFVEYLSTASWPRFDLLEDPVRQQWELTYGAWSSIFTLQAELQHRFTRLTSIQLSAAVRSSHDDELDEAIPYLPSLELRTLLAHDFPFGLGVQATVQLVGEQYTQDGDLPAWMLLGLELEYQLFRNFGLFLRASNLLDNDYQRWRGYQERPLFVIGGATFRM